MASAEQNKAIENFKSFLEDNEIILYDKCNPPSHVKDNLNIFAITAKPNESDLNWIDVSEVWVNKSGSVANYAYTVTIPKESIKKLYEEFK